MPTIHREAGFNFNFYSDEPGEPAHVHIIRGNAQVKIWLDPPALCEARGFKRSEVDAMLRIVSANAPRFLERWHGFFGTRPPDPAPRR